MPGVSVFFFPGRLFSGDYLFFSSVSHRNPAPTSFKTHRGNSAQLLHGLRPTVSTTQQNRHATATYRASIPAELFTPCISCSLTRHDSPVEAHEHRIHDSLSASSINLVLPTAMLQHVVKGKSPSISPPTTPHPVRQTSTSTATDVS